MAAGRVAAALVAVILSASHAAAAPRNVLLLLTDDQAWDTLGLIDPRLSTPNLDRLFTDGTWFEQATVSTSVCPASRLSILTGLYFPAHRFTFGQARPEVSLLRMSYPALLRQRGYHSVFIGKNGLLLNDDRNAILFDEWTEHPREYPTGDGGHLTDVIAGQAADFIRRRAGAGPWSLVVWFHAPHADDDVGDVEPFLPPQRHESFYDGVDFPERDGATGWPARPGFFERTMNRKQGRQWWSGDYQRNMRRYHAMIRGLDDAVGELRDALQTTGQADDTLIVFLSDNGLYRGERGFGGKWLGHEASVRVPMAIVDPARPAGIRVDELVTNVDVAPTILQRLGVRVPRWMQGRSLAPFLAGREVPDWREETFLEHSWTAAGGPRIPRTRGLRTRRYKYLEYPGRRYRELYDLASDPGELVNLAGEPGFATDEARLRDLARSLERDYGDALFADGFEAGNARRWPLRLNAKRRRTVVRQGEALHPWMLAPSLDDRRRVWVGRELPPRGAVDVGFRLSAAEAAPALATAIAVFEGPGETVRLSLAGAGTQLVLQGAGPRALRADLPPGWVDVRVSWRAARGRYTLSIDGRDAGRLPTDQSHLQTMLFGLPEGGGSGSGRVGLDEFLILARE